MLANMVSSPRAALLFLISSTAMALAIAIPFGFRADATLREEDLVGIVVNPPLITLTRLGETAQLHVKGVYTGGRVRPLPISLREAGVFSSDSPDVVSVSPEGKLRAMKNGGADVHVSLDAWTARVPVIVALPTVQVPRLDPEKLVTLDKAGTAIVLDRVIIVGAKGTNVADIEKVASQLGARILVAYGQLGAYLIELSTETPETLLGTLQQLTADQRISVALPNLVFPETGHGIDTLLLSTRAKSAYTEFGMERAWSLLEEHLRLPSPVTVAVIDSGIALDVGNHEFDRDNVVVSEMIEGLRRSSYPSARANHGTAVTSIIAAKNSGEEDLNDQVSGLLPSVPKLPYRVLFYQVGIQDSEGTWRHMDMSAIFAAIDDILTKKGQIDVVNMSFASSCYRPDLTGVRREILEFFCSLFTDEDKKKASYALKFSEMPDVLFVAAAGNESEDTANVFPASVSYLANTITVGATSGDGRAEFSNFGTPITVGAPGVYVWSVDAQGVYKGRNGTSFSAPLTAGLVGLVRSIAPQMTPEDVKELLRATSRVITVCTTDTRPCPSGRQEQWHVLRADQAVDKALRDAGLIFDRVVLVGTVPGKFTTNGGSFRLSVSPKDETGRLIKGGISESDFRFKDVTASHIAAPDIIVSHPAVQVIDVDILGEGSRTTKTIVLLFDSSGSMDTSDPSRLRVVAGEKIIELLQEGDAGAVLDFGAGASRGRRASRVLQDITADKSALRTAVGRITQSGGTPLYDGLLDALDLSSQVASGSAIVVLTDGKENESFSSFAQVVARATELKVPIFTVGLGRGIDFGELQSLASDSEGTFAEATDAEALATVLQNVGVGVVEGRVVVTGEGTFAPPLATAGQYTISGLLETHLDREVFETPFSFVVEVR